MLQLNNTVPSATKPAEVPTYHAVTYVLFPAVVGASTVNVIAEVSHIKNKEIKSSYVSVWCAFPGKDRTAGHQEPLKPTAPLQYNHIL